MANWDILKKAISDVIKTNDNQEITGAVLQQILNSIVTNVGENATFAGIATPSTNPGTPDGPVFYLATELGIYSNFNSIVISDSDGVVILNWSNSVWAKVTSGFASEVSVQNVKIELETITGCKDITYNDSDLTVDAYFDLTKASAPASPSTGASGWKCLRISASSGNKYILTTTGGSNGRAYAFVKADLTILEVADASKSFSNQELTAPAGSAYLYVNVYPSAVFLLIAEIDSSTSLLSRITTNSTNIAKNTTDIAKNTTNIANNATNLNNAIGGYKSDSLTANAYYNLSGTSAPASPLTGASDWSCIRLNVSEGSSFVLTTTGGVNARAYAFTKADLTILEVRPAEQPAVNGETIKAPAGSSYLYVNCLANVLSSFAMIPCSIANTIFSISEQVGKNTENITSHQELLSKLFATQEDVTGTFVQYGVISKDDGSFISMSGYTIKKYEVSEGDVLQIYTNIGDGSNVNRAQVAAYNDTTFVGVVSTGNIITDISYIVPSNVTNICVYSGGDRVQNVKRRTGTEILDSVNTNTKNIQSNASRIESLEKEILSSKSYSTSDLYIDADGWKSYYFDLHNGIGTIAQENPSKFESSETRWGCIKLAISKGQVLSVCTKGGGNGRAYAITDSSRNILVVADANKDTTAQPFTYTVEQDGYLYVNVTPNTLAAFSVNIITPFQAVLDKIDNNTSRIKTLENEISIACSPKISNAQLDIRKDVKSELKVLDIGNSFTEDPTCMLTNFISAASLDISDMCLYRCIRGGGSFKSFYDSWHNNDTYSGTTDPTCHYSVSKLFGGLTQNISGTNALERMHSCFKDVKWDLIIIHQVSSYSNNYDIWEGNTDGGYLKEFIRLIKLWQPQATIGFLMPHTSYNQSSSGDTQALYAQITKSTKEMQVNYGIDFIIPVATSIENLRISNTLKTLYPNVTKAYSRDGHHLGYGLARYVANAIYFQCLLGKRYGNTVYGNTLRYVVSDSEKSSATYPDDCIDVTDENATLAQLCAISAYNDMYNITSPDNLLETIEN